MDVIFFFEQRGGLKGPASEEKVTIDFAFASVCSIKNIKKEIYLQKKIYGLKDQELEIS